MTELQIICLIAEHLYLSCSKKHEKVFSKDRSGKLKPTSSKSLFLTIDDNTKPWDSKKSSPLEKCGAASM